MGQIFGWFPKLIVWQAIRQPSQMAWCCQSPSCRPLYFSQQPKMVLKPISHTYLHYLYLFLLGYVLVWARWTSSTSRLPCCATTLPVFYEQWVVTKGCAQWVPVMYKSLVFVIIGHVYGLSSQKLLKKNDGLKDVSRMEDIFGVERIQNLKYFLALKPERPISWYR